MSKAIGAAIGEGSTFVFEKVYLGEMSAKDVDAIRDFMEQKLNSEFVGKVTEVIEGFASSEQGKNSLKDLAGNLVKTLGPSTGKASS